MRRILFLGHDHVLLCTIKRVLRWIKFNWTEFALVGSISKRTQTIIGFEEACAC